MRTLLLLATAATILTTTAAHRAAPHADRQVVARSQGAGPDMIRDSVRHAIGFDRLAPLLAHRPR